MKAILLTGWSASGKSTVAHTMSNHYNFPVLSPRKLLHDHANQLGYKRTREWLVNEGPQVVADVALEVGKETIFALAKTNGIIWDDTFDPRLPILLRNKLGSEQVIIVVIETERSRRETYMAQRLEKDSESVPQELTLLDSFKKQVGIEAVMQMADLTVSNSQNLEQAIYQIYEGLRRFGIEAQFTRSRIEYR